MLKFAIKNMMVKKVKIILIVFSIVISSTVALLAFNVSEQVDDGFKTTAGYYDMIIGPSGSSTQLAMNTMFFTDKTLGTISYEYYEKLSSDERINKVIPFTMCDSYNGAKIVGTSADYLEGKALIEGEMFEESYEAVIGYSVAQKYGLSVGDSLITSHGLSEGGSAHKNTPLTVVGILGETTTSYDNVIFTSVETVWATHDHSEKSEHEEEHEEEHHGEHGEVCALLVKTKSFNYYNQVKNEYSGEGNLLVINPSEVLREVLQNVDLSSKIVYILCIIIVVMNVFIISVITLLNTYDSKKEISLMRLIGISMKKINLLYVIQNGIVGIASTVLALISSRLCLALMSEFVASMGIVLNCTKIYPMEWAIMAVIFVISVLPTVVCTLIMSGKDGGIQ